MDSSAMSGHPPAQGHPQQLSTEQIQWLFQHMSSDDQKEVGKMMRDCTSEMTLTRGLPFAAFCVGSLYFARSRLPENLRFGPKRWPFYFLIGVGAMTTANLLSMNKCADRVKPKLAQLFEQYNQGAAASTVRYDQLREQNRARQFGAPSPLSSDVSQSMGREETFDLTPPATIDGSQPPSSRFLYEQPGPAMISGTPTRRDPSAFYSNESRAQRPEGSNQYGDRDFS